MLRTRQISLPLPDDGNDIPNRVLETLYARPVTSSRGGPLFNAHTYPTKINPEAIVPFILAHTKPGDLIFDGFAGTGVTGLATALSLDPDTRLASAIEGQLGAVSWGPRKGVLYDVSELSAFVGRVLLNPPDPDDFEHAASELLASLNSELGWMYHLKDDPSAESIRHTIWTDYPICPQCHEAESFWNLAVNLSPLQIQAVVTCPKCGKIYEVARAERLTEEYWDDLLRQPRIRRVRTPAYVYGQTGTATWKRAANEDDLALLKQIQQTNLPAGIPITTMLGSAGGRWGELYRSGYHEGITHLHDFYTRRNLIAIAVAWQATKAYPHPLRDALRLWISSYNAAHSTLMTRVVCKAGATDFVVTSAQPAALYISSLPVEKNVLRGLRTKMPHMIAAFQAMFGRSGNVTFRCASSLHTDLADSSVDYIFTDPPFGNNIQYSEVNFISEAWLGRITDASEEVIVSTHQGKSTKDYELLLTAAFKEGYRILKSGHYMTVVFHSAQSNVWDALRHAWETSGFQMIHTSRLDKTQTSFKQTTTHGAVRGDAVILLRKPVEGERELQTRERTGGSDLIDPWKVIAERLAELETDEADDNERDRQRLYSHLVNYCLKHQVPVSLDASDFFAELDVHFERRGDLYYLP